MEAGLVGDDHMERTRITRGDLLEEDRVDVLVDGWGEEQLAVVRTVNLERLMQLAPFVGGGVGRVNTNAAQRPYPPDDRQESVAVFIENPQPHRACREPGQPLR